MRQLDKIQKRLLDRDRYILIPKAMKDSPVPMAKMQKDDVDGNLLVGEYYSPQDLANHFGKFYIILDWVDDAHILITWGASENGEMQSTKAFMTSQGLVNIRDDGSEFGLDTSDVDWTAIPANGFAILSLSDLRAVPRVAVPAEVLP